MQQSLTPCQIKGTQSATVQKSMSTGRLGFAILYPICFAVIWSLVPLTHGRWCLARIISVNLQSNTQIVSPIIGDLGKPSLVNSAVFCKICKIRNIHDQRDIGHINSTVHIVLCSLFAVLTLDKVPEFNGQDDWRLIELITEQLLERRLTMPHSALLQPLRLQARALLSRWDILDLWQNNKEVAADSISKLHQSAAAISSPSSTDWLGDSARHPRCWLWPHMEFAAFSCRSTCKVLLQLATLFGSNLCTHPSHGVFRFESWLLSHMVVLLW